MDELTALLPRLRRYARALTGDRQRADDLVQDTVERALRRWVLWRPGSRLDRWLMTVMHNLFVSQVRHQQGLTTEALDELAVEPAMRATQLDQLELADLQAALNQLPAEQREVLLLVALDERSYAEVAELLQIPPGTVMSRLSRARQRLRQLLPDAGLSSFASPVASAFAGSNAATAAPVPLPHSPHLRVVK